MAFSNAARVMIFDGRRSSTTTPTARRPVAYAICERSRYGAGMLAQPGNDIPSASASEFIERAVPIVLQCPALGVEEHTRSMNPSKSVSPASNLRRASHTAIPDTDNFPSNQPSSIGPPDKTIAGVSVVATAIRQAGVVLSHAVINTTPSIGYPCRISTNPR